jgi:hypothetical protein
MDIPPESVHDVDYDACCDILHAAEESRGALEEVLFVCSSRVHELMNTKKTCSCRLLWSWLDTRWFNDPHCMFRHHYHLLLNTKR